jgi:F0F1-type ATP synthase delta subunit
MTLQKDFQDKMQREKDDVKFYVDIIEKAAKETKGYRALSRALSKGEVYITNALSRQKISQLKKICKEIIDRNIIK